MTTENWNDPLWEKLVEVRTIALEEARKSPCKRRKYGAALFSLVNDVTQARHNAQVSICCKDECLRNKMHIMHGMQTDIGAEIHAEQALIIDAIYLSGPILIAGYDSKGNPLFDEDCWPCYSCARMLAYASIDTVWVPIEGDKFRAYSIYTIIDRHNERLDYLSHGDA